MEVPVNVKVPQGVVDGPQPPSTTKSPAAARLRAIRMWLSFDRSRMVSTNCQIQRANPSKVPTCATALRERNAHRLPSRMAGVENSAIPVDEWIFRNPPFNQVVEN